MRDDYTKVRHPAIPSGEQQRPIPVKVYRAFTRNRTPRL